jgi:hypothetical protein
MILTLHRRNQTLVSDLIAYNLAMDRHLRVEMLQLEMIPAINYLHNLRNEMHDLKVREREREIEIEIEIEKRGDK